MFNGGADARSLPPSPRPWSHLSPLPAHPFTTLTQATVSPPPPPYCCPYPCPYCTPECDRLSHRRPRPFTLRTPLTRPELLHTLRPPLEPSPFPPRPVFCAPPSRADAGRGRGAQVGQMREELREARTASHRKVAPRTKWTRRVPHPVLIGHAAYGQPPQGRPWGLLWGCCARFPAQRRVRFVPWEGRDVSD
jgi:hypothetical protein